MFNTSYICSSSSRTHAISAPFEDLDSKWRMDLHCRGLTAPLEKLGNNIHEPRIKVCDKDRASVEIELELPRNHGLIDQFKDDNRISCGVTDQRFDQDDYIVCLEDEDINGQPDIHCERPRIEDCYKFAHRNPEYSGLENGNGDADNQCFTTAESHWTHIGQSNCHTCAYKNGHG